MLFFNINITFAKNKIYDSLANLAISGPRFRYR